MDSLSHGLAGHVQFALAGRVYATGLADVREVVRLVGLEELPGMAAPMAGVLTLRGAPLPVLDVRPAGGGRGTGDVLVLAPGSGDVVGFAVDAVLAVRAEGELVPASPGTASTAGLPGYVVGVLRDSRAGDAPVLEVDVHRLTAAVAA